MIIRKKQGAALAFEGGNRNCKSIGGTHGGILKSKRIANGGSILFFLSNVGRKSDSLCWSNSFLVLTILSASQTKYPSGGVTKALLTGSTTQIQSARPDFQINMVDIDEAQMTTVPPAERLHRAVEVFTSTCSTQPKALQVCKISPFQGQVTRFSDAAVPQHAYRVSPLSATPGG